MDRATRPSKANTALPRQRLGRPAQPLVVLLVDDDADCRLLVRDALAESSIAAHGLEVFEVGDGEAALRFLRRQGAHREAPRPDLIYLDLEMPCMDGLATLQQIKQDPALRDIPTVMFTGVADEEQIRQAACLGANSYTIKPLDVEQLLRTIAESTDYWFRVHQSPQRHLPAEECRRLKRE